MQLLDSEQLEFAFRLYGVTLEAQARRFYADVWQIIQDAEKAQDAASLRVYERQLKVVCRSYFEEVKEWREEREDSLDCAEISEVGRDNMREATNVLPLLEKQFYRYALCYMELNRALIRSRAKITHFVQDHNIEQYGKGLDVNHGTGGLLARSHRELAAVQRKIALLERMKILLQVSDPMIEELGALLPRLYPVEGDRQLTLFKGALRRAEIDRAAAIASAWSDGHVRATGSLLAEIFKRNQPMLRINESILLHSGELVLPLSILKSDEVKERAFLEKYNIPYMVFQFRGLLHLGYMLGRIGSIEGLIIQHAKLASLSVRAQTDSDYAKNQQHLVLLPVRALLETKFPTLGAIFNDMEVIVATLEKLVLQTREYQAHTKA